MSWLWFLLLVLSLGFAVFSIMRSSKIENVADKIAEENRQIKSKAQQIWEENQRLAKWRPIINAEDEASKILSNAKKESEGMISQAKSHSDQVTSWADAAKKRATAEAEGIKIEARSLMESELSYSREEFARLTGLIDNAYKEYRYRKTLPDTHEKLKAKYDELKARADQLAADLKESKSAAKTATMSSKDKEKLLAQFDKLARTYVEDTFKFIMSKMTTSNFTASRDPHVNDKLVID